MNYTIDIIDTLNDEYTTLLEYAEKSSIVLNWNGTDEKAIQNIVGSSLAFTLEVNIANSKDAAFVHLFTGNETRYKVRLYKTDDDTTVWSGFLLPDSHQEPYTNETFYVNFDATDGLGRLKGKYLDASFYTGEHSVITVIAECLKLTGLELPISFAAAIENSIEKNYANIYLSGDWFNKKEKQKDAYTVLNELLGSMLCVVYQADNNWIVEGFNQRHLSKLAYWFYDFNGVLQYQGKSLRTLKNLNPLGKPFITMVPPLADIEITHEREAQALPETIGIEKNEGWFVGQGVSGDVFPTYWFANGDYLPIAKAPDYKVTLYTVSATEIDSTKFISLKDKLYVNKYDKLTFSGKFKTQVNPIVGGLIIPNGLRIQFLLNGSTLYSVDTSFIDEYLEVVFDVYATASGLLDLRLYQPFSGGTLELNTFSPNVFIEKLELTEIAFNDTQIVNNTINDEFTVGHEQELDYADDAAGLSKAFRLAKLEENAAEYNEIDIPVLYGFNHLDINYAVVSLYGANLISDNVNDVFRDAVQLTDIEVIYNYLEGEEMAVITPTLIVDGSLTVRRYRTKDIEGDRRTWEQWTDTIYPIETDRYADSVAKLYRRLFPVAHESIEFLADAALKFNDIVQFNYVLPRNYFLTTVAWNIDNGETTGTMVRALYQNEIFDIGTGNIPPIVNAGNDVTVAQNFGEYVELFGVISLIHNTASAHDPDGFIVSYLWTIETGDQNAVLGNRDTLTPTLSGFSGDELVLRLTVTDSDGATAYDTVTFKKEFATTITSTVDLDYLATFLEQKRDVLVFSPDIPDSYALKLKGNFYFNVASTLDGVATTITYNVHKNGAVILSHTISNQEENTSEITDFEFNYIKGNEIKIEVIVHIHSFYPGDRTQVRHTTGYKIDTVQYQVGGGEVLGLPLSNEIVIGTL